MRGFIYLDVVGGGWGEGRVGEEWKELGEKNLAEPQKLLKQHVKNQQFFNS